ncbi:DUF4249 domain-containing protein [Carboxylicivirga linearis]|uniref:DUF4249 family protein n=1 Tax=Carboxylicivirga linearis TaxID=1628157 RepID=A0ABS5JTJ2_9BACT|nr:DUF4249 domain-containing protein [Carboxylicivirga linearis]MBS2097854.1 DUF4249 family protein [Carboxylicivirga linearis]
MHKWWFILLLLSVACTKDVDLEQVDYERKIVVDGWIENGQKAQVFLTMSSPFLTEYDSASIRSTFLNYAKVTMLSSDGESEILTLKIRDEFFPPFVYESIKMKGKVGATYQLEVVYQDEVLTASTTIPELPRVDSVKFSQVSDTSIIINGFIDDDPAVSNYYYTQIKTLHYSTRFHPSGNPLMNDQLFNGHKHSYQVKRSNQPDPLNIYGVDAERPIIRDEFAIDDTVFVKISHIDWESFEVLNGIFIDNLSQGSPFSFVDQKTPTNINGGIGRWTGLASRNYVVYK